MAYSSSACIAVVATFLPVASISVVLRFFTRRYILNSVKLDDWLSLLAFSSYVVASSFFLRGLSNNVINKNADKNTFSDNVEATKDILVIILTFYAGTGFIKVSLVLTLFRIVRDRTQTFVLYAITAVTICITIIVFFVTLFHCSPIHDGWEKLGLGPNCRPASVTIGFNWAHGIYLIITDVCLGLIIPVWLVWGLNMQTRVKISALALLSLGFLASVASVIRLVYLSKVRVYNTYSTQVESLLWVLIELFVNIVCTSLASLKPLLVHLRTFKSMGYSSRGRGTEGDYNNDWQRATHNINRNIRSQETWLDSDEDIFLEPSSSELGGITKTTEVGVVQTARVL